jgi:hypothetical protein
LLKDSEIDYDSIKIMENIRIIREIQLKIRFSQQEKKLHANFDQISFCCNLAFILRRLLIVPA